MAGAPGLAEIFGTEKDRVNCPFFFKIGACRHGDRCSRFHNRPSFSPTLLLVNMYQRPDMITRPGYDAQGNPIEPEKIQEHFEDFYEDIFEELSKYGDIENLKVCDNVSDHMVGNVYVEFRDEDQATVAFKALQGRWYSGRPIIAEFSPVTDFRDAGCRQFEDGRCTRGQYCNFMHPKKISDDLWAKLFGGRRRRSRHGRGRSRSRSRSRSPGHHRRDHRDPRDARERDDHRDPRDARDRDDHRGRRGGDRHRDGGQRRRSPARGSSEERRARIEQWNREREENNQAQP